MELVCPSIEDVVAIYRAVTGRRDDPVRPDGLASAVALPIASMFGDDLYPSIFGKAAALLRSLAQNQPFIDGNNRTAWVAARVFLDLNGIEINATADDVVALMIAIAKKQATVASIADFLAERAALKD